MIVVFVERQVKKQVGCQASSRCVWVMLNASGLKSCKSRWSNCAGPCDCVLSKRAMSCDLLSDSKDAFPASISVRGFAASAVCECLKSRRVWRRHLGDALFAGGGEE